MAGLTNFELEKYCKTIIGFNFLGVFPCDSFPQNFKNKKTNISCIFNLSPHYATGSHFVAILKIKKTFIYFDSFGKVCKNKSILKFLKSNTDELLCSNKVIQSKTSTFCGLFCLAFLIICQKNKKSIKFFLTRFKKSLSTNDEICLKLILNNLH